MAEALRAGYRLIDTAASYFNEREVGEGIRRSGLDRSEVFIETKVWLGDYGYDETLHAFDKSAGKLGADQIDLLLLHQAAPTDFDRTIQAYKALETLLADAVTPQIVLVRPAGSLGQCHRVRHVRNVSLGLDVGSFAANVRGATENAGRLRQSSLPHLGLLNRQSAVTVCVSELRLPSVDPPNAGALGSRANGRVRGGYRSCEFAEPGGACSGSGGSSRGG